MQKSFGIGCFHFGVSKTPPFTFKGKDYITELKSTLSSVPNINDINIETDNEFEEMTVDVKEDLPNLNKELGVFPSSIILNIEFKLYIPYRLQAEIKEIDEKRLDTHSEYFKVKLVHSYHLPVAIIEVISPKENPTPSSAVLITRIFLEREIKKQNSNYIRFEFLGPSPFHLNCYLFPKESEELDEYYFDSEEVLIKGYNDLIIYYNQDEFEDEIEAFDNIELSIADEFGFYYLTQQEKFRKMNAWEKIEENLKKLSDIQNLKGIKGFWKKLRFRQTLIGELFNDITTFEAESIFNESLEQHAYKLVFLVKEEIFFKTFIDLELEEQYNYPIKQATELINFYESRRVTQNTLIIALISSILGGAIGAILTNSLS